MDIIANPLTADAFAPYGEVIAIDPVGRAGRNDFAARMDNRRGDAELNISISRHVPIELPLTVERMEIHPHSSQAFIPMEISRFLVLVCPTDPAGDPDLARMMAFVGARDQGICYRPDVWHHPFGVLDAPSQCTVLRFDMRNEEDTVWFEATDGPRIVGPAES